MRVSPRFVPVRNLALLALLAAGATYGGMRLDRAMQGDAFSGLKRPQGTSPIAATLQSVRFRHYHKGKLVTSAHAAKLDLHRDRRTFEMHGVTNALYKGENRTFRYAAGYAKWDANSAVLTASGKPRLRNDKLDLNARALRFERPKKTVTVTGAVKGKFYDGQLEAENLVMFTDNEAFTAGPVRWNGAMALAAQDGGDDQTREWSIIGQQASRSRTNPNVFEYTQAVATDGEVIVIAPKAEWDRKTDVLTATGRVQYFSAKANFVGNRCVVFRRERRAVLSGDVQMLVKPKSEQDGKPKVEPIPAFQPLNPSQVAPTVGKKPLTPKEKERIEKLRDPKSVREYPLAISSATIEYWYGRGVRRAVIQGNPQARQEFPDGKWRHIWTNVAYYNGETDMLKLVSTKGRKDTRFMDSVGDDFVADWMEMAVQEEREEDAPWTGWGFEGKFVSLDDEIPRPAPKTGSGTTGGGRR